MDTILKKWRQEECEDLLAIYEKIENLINQDDPITVKQCEEIRSWFNIGHDRISGSADGHKIVIGLLTEALEIGNDEENKSGYFKRIERYKNSLLKDARWNEYSEVDAHVIHMHLKRLHGENFREAFKNHGVLRQIPYRTDYIEGDALSIHIISNKCKEIDGSVILNSDANIESRKERIAKAIQTIEKTGPSWGMIPGLKMRGIQMHANYKNDNVEINDDNLIIEVKELPESLRHHEFDGKRIHDIIDVEGFRDDKMTVKKTTITKDQIILKFNRHSPHMRHQIKLDFS